uniref:Uncharacterized protein n=1 Tax=Photinus pyralis TaxID=7054 RepID=A0A1Y1JUL0_PHOPY
MSKRSRGKESASVSTKGSKEQGGRVRALLTRLSAHDLEGIKVVIRRPYLPDLPTSSPPVIETSLDDPTSLVVHRRVQHTIGSSLPSVSLMQYLVYVRNLTSQHCQLSTFYCR